MQCRMARLCPAYMRRCAILGEYQFRLLEYTRKLIVIYYTTATRTGWPFAVPWTASRSFSRARV